MVLPPPLESHLPVLLRLSSGLLKDQKVIEPAQKEIPLLRGLAIANVLQLIAPAHHGNVIHCGEASLQQT